MNNQNDKPLLLLEGPKMPPNSSIQGDTTEKPEPPFINGQKRASESGRDPSTGQFLEGNRGGPGRPVGYNKMATMIEEELQELAAKDAEGKPLPIKRALVKKIVKMALGGDRKMIEMIWNYQDGKPPLHIDVTSKGQRLGKRDLSAEEIKRIDDMYAPKEWPDDVSGPVTAEIDEQSNPQSKTIEDGREGDAGEVALAHPGHTGSAYEGDA